MVEFGSGKAYPSDGAVPEVHVLEFNRDRKPHLNTWHADHSWKPMPSDIEFLMAELLPSKGGGTLWADAALAWSTLSAPLQQLLANAKCEHSLAHGYTEGFQDSDREEMKKQHKPVV